MSTEKGWIHTARRVVPAFFALSRELEPTWRYDSVADIDAEALAEQGVSTLLWDVDGTLMPHHATAIHPAVVDRFEALRRDARFRHAVVSNCQLDRFAELGGMFPDMPVILSFTTPDGPAFRVREHGAERFTGPGASRLDGDPGAVRPMRKPSADLVVEALRLLDAPASGAVLIGDQHFTDIASANLAGIRSIKVPTMDPGSFPAAVRISQRFERFWVGVRRVLGFGRDARRDAPLSARPNADERGTGAGETGADRPHG